MEFSRSVLRHALTALLLWSVALGASLAWNIHLTTDHSRNLALNTARASFNKDQAYRLWANSHGGVYVEPDERTPPNPYLSHLPDRDIVTTSGRKLTLMNPAYMLRQMMSDYSDLYGIKGKITGKVVLNPVNQPDHWERLAIDRFEQGEDEVLAFAEIGGKPYLRLMRPMVMVKGCEKCHGHLGFREGDIRGGVGVAVPLESYLAYEQQTIGSLTATHGAIWTVGFITILLVWRRSDQRHRERNHLIEELKLAAKVVDDGLDGVLITDSDGIILRVNRIFTEVTGYTAQEVLGKTPRILRSNHHGLAFYKGMWDSLIRTGRWEGEIWNRHMDGHGYAVWQSISAVKDSYGIVSHYVGVFRDITERKQTEDQLYQLSHYDLLTRLPNRMLLRGRLAHALQRLVGNEDGVALLFIDLDDFKQVNDTLGHSIGDTLLVEAAERLQACGRGCDSVARLGGDEFAILFESIVSTAAIDSMVTTIQEQFSRPFTLGGREIHVSTSIGVGIAPRDSREAEELIRNAETAMYRAKKQGRGHFAYYDSEMSELAERRLALEVDLRRAVEQGEFTLLFQPKVDSTNLAITGAEALIRWNHPQRGMIGPDQFIPVCEENGLIVPIGRWVLETACLTALDWIRRGNNHFTIAVNLSGIQVDEPSLVESIRSILEETGLPANHLELEVTEGFLMTGERHRLETLNRLHEMGIKLSIDDFGTGYSSLAYLKRLPIHRIKIDRSFVSGLPEDEKDSAIVNAIVAMAKSLKLQLTAEGVETETQLEQLRLLGCEEIQGYLIARPLPADHLSRMLEEERDDG